MSLAKMNREVKFRAKSWYGNPPMWQEGYIYQTSGGWFMKSPDGSIMEINPETIGEYTGLKDIDGKDIFEGDILELGYYATFIGEVVWNETIAAFTLREKDGERYGKVPLGVWIADGHQLRVVGNIYDNAEKL